VRMSHFTVTVCLPAGVSDVAVALVDALAPFDENTAVTLWWTERDRAGCEEARGQAQEEVT
jgi:hypothetical protein